MRAIEAMDRKGIRALPESCGLKVSSLNSAGYFLFADPERARTQAGLDTRLIAAPAELEAQTLAVITGGIAHGKRQAAEARTRCGWPNCARSRSATSTAGAECCESQV